MLSELSIKPDATLARRRFASAMVKSRQAIIVPTGPSGGMSVS
jgi:hypothetical protein